MTLTAVILIVVANIVYGAWLGFLAEKSGIIRIPEMPLRVILIGGIATISQIPQDRLREMLLGDHAGDALPFCLAMLAYWAAFYAVICYFGGGGGWWNRVKDAPSRLFNTLSAKLPTATPSPQLN
jgi:hypothetical protein